MTQDGMICADAIPAMVWFSNADGLRTYFNRAWLEFTGRTLQQESGNGWTEVIHPDDARQCLDTYHSAIQSGRGFTMEYRLRRADGEYRWILSQGEPRRVNGEMEGFVGSAVDITDQKATERIGSLLAAVVQSSDDAIVTKDLNGIITSWNTSAQRIFGYTEEEVLGKPITILIPPELQSEEKEILSRLKSGQRIEHFETVRFAKGGERVLVSLTVSPVKDASGKIVAASKVARDITRTKQVEDALRESEQRMRFCLQAAHVGTWEWDMQTGDVHWSENMEEIHGQQAGSFSRTFEDFLRGVREEDRQRVQQAIQQALHGDGKYHVEYRQIKADGTLAWMEAHGKVIYDSSNLPQSMMGVCRDISERKLSEAALKEAHEQLEARVRERTSELNRAQERLRMLSVRLLRSQDDERRRIARELHDTAGQLLVALTLTLVPVEEALRRNNPELAKQITASLGLVDELSRDLRTMSHLLHPPLLDEAGLHSAVRWYVEGFAERSKIRVDLQLDPEVGRLPGELETAVFRIVQECLTNIHRHSESNSASIAITRDVNHIKLEIRDRGKGMPVPTPRAGIGIQGMRERARQMGGALEIHSSDDGTRVTATFSVDAPCNERSPETMDLAS
jgi:PAS domain S-box-containing protein